MIFSFINIIESAVMLAVFYFLYNLILKKETFFKWNRTYLILSLLFSVTIPFLNVDLGSFGGFVNKAQNLKSGYYELNEVVIYAYSGEFTFAAIMEYVKAIYLLGLIISLSFFIVGLCKIIWLILKTKSKKLDNYRIIETNDNIVPFSLFKWIIINPEKYSSDDLEQIIAHEKMHAFQLHSLDLIFIEVLVILFWFNPFIYWYRKSIREVHEFLADQAVVENGFDHISYQKLLLNQVVGNRFIGLTSRFSYSLSKNRLKMLTMMKSKNISKTKLFLAIPLAIAFAFFFINSSDLVKASVLNNSSELIEIQQDTVKVEIEEIEGKVYQEVEVMPKFNNGTAEEFRYHIQKSLKYPAIAHKNKEQGTVHISFVVDKAGIVKNAKVVRGVSPSLDHEALRVVKNSPLWTPGESKGEKVNVEYTFPISFKLK